VASLSQGRTAAAQCGLFTYKSVPVIFEAPCTFVNTSPDLVTYFYNGMIKSDYLFHFPNNAVYSDYI